jgi:hypothetical protein
MKVVQVLGMFGVGFVLGLVAMVVVYAVAVLAGF